MLHPNASAPGRENLHSNGTPTYSRLELRAGFFYETLLKQPFDNGTYGLTTKSRQSHEGGTRDGTLLPQMVENTSLIGNPSELLGQ